MDTKSVKITMYTFSLGSQHYERWRDGRPFTLMEAMREVFGVGAATVYRVNPDATLTVVVCNAGSSTAIVHAPTGRTLARRSRPQPRLGRTWRRV